MGNYDRDYEAVKRIDERVIQYLNDEGVLKKLFEPIKCIIIDKDTNRSWKMAFPGYYQSSQVIEVIYSRIDLKGQYRISNWPKVNYYNWGSGYNHVNCWMCELENEKLYIERYDPKQVERGVLYGCPRAKCMENSVLYQVSQKIEVLQYY